MADWIPTSEAAALSGYTLRHVRLLITGGRVKGQRLATSGKYRAVRCWPI